MASSVLGYGRQSIDQSDIDAVISVLRGDFLTQGPAVERFEAALAERVGARHAVAVSNGTAGLHLACLAAGIKPGDRGLTAAVTFVASANCFLYAGADAGFVDIDADTLGMTAVALEKALASGPEVKAIIPVHLSGLAHDSQFAFHMALLWSANAFSMGAINMLLLRSKDIHTNVTNQY